MNQYTTTNVSCLEIRDLFSPWLDGEITPEEIRLLEAHIETCIPCSEELRAWQSLSANLKEIEYTIDIPPDFSDQVISKIKTKKHRKVAYLYKTHFKLVAAAAALLVFTSSMGLINSFFPLKKNNPEVNTGPPAIVSTEGKTNVGHPTEKPVTTPETTPTHNENEPGPKTTDSVKPVKPDAKANIDTQVQTGYTAPTELELLDNEIKIKSTLVKLASDDPSGTITKASGMVAGEGTVSRTVSGQNTGSKPISIITITVPEKESNVMINSLTSLGEVIDKSNEVKDITYRYKEALARQQELSSLLKSPGENKASYQTEYASLNSQLKEWNKQATNHTIILWIEKGQGN